jgi:hypothetical protein
MTDDHSCSCGSITQENLMQASPSPSVTPGPGVTAPDHDITTLTRFPCAGAALIRLGAVCNTAGATLTCRLVFFDALGAFAAVSAAVTFTADAAPLAGPLYLATPNVDAWFPVGGPSICAIHVDAVSGGTWTLLPTAA